ncbi:MAG: rod shape-determining protein MreD [Actinomycetota bacterium]|nr:rod shape-determining protein MreD [Actinomycetota bacterium]
MSDAPAIAVLVFLAALFQVTIFTTLELLGGTADLLLVALIGIALLRGSVAGALAGFFGGLLLDVLTLDTLGVTALVLALAGFWTGRYGETTGRGRARASLAAVVVVTILVAVFGYGLHFLIGEEVSARRALLETLLPSIGLNLLLAVPVVAFCRRLLRPFEGRTAEVQLLG